MDKIYSVMLNLRRILGFFLPGFAWLFLIYVLFHDRLALDTLPLLENDVLLIAVIVFLSYVVGTLNIQLSFRVLKNIGDVIDLGTSRLATKHRRARSVIEWFAARANVFNTTTLTADRARNCPLSREEQQALGEHASYPDVCKLQLVDQGSKLVPEVLEAEADINFHAGIVPPILFAALGLYGVHTAASLVLFIIAVYFGLRFQHLRHYEVDVIYLAYKIHRQSPKNTLTRRTLT